MLKKLVGWMLRASMIWKAWKEKQTIKGDWGWLAKNYPMMKLVSLSNSRIPIFWKLSKGKNLPLFVKNECLYSATKVVICLVTSPTFVEVRSFTSYNRYRSYDIYSYFL